MLDSITGNILNPTAEMAIPLSGFLICIAVALGIGILLVLIYKRNSKSSPGFLATLAILPAVVAMVMIMVNGSLGAGVAVAGAFSLVRFRSAPGTAREIGALFIAMAAGLAAGMGYLAFAVIFTIILCLVELVYSSAVMQRFYGAAQTRQLRITIPEDLDYSDLFADIFQSCLERWELNEVKTTNLGSLFRLTYSVQMKGNASEKKMIDALRCRNGNLEISLSRPLSGHNEL